MTHLPKPVRRTTLGALSYGFGSDTGRKLVATLSNGDVLILRPAGTRREETISLFDVYRYAITCRVNAQRMEKLRAKKAAKAEAQRQRKWKAELRRAQA